MAKYVVLNDGETFSNLDGCTVVDIPDDCAEAYEAVDGADDIRDVCNNRDEFPSVRVYDMVESVLSPECPRPIIDLEEIDF